MNEKEECIQILKQKIAGEVKADLMTRHIYSVDASIFEIPPIAVVLPKDVGDIVNTVEIARHFNIPITPRGGATGIAGGCLGEGIILDTTKYMNRILECDLTKGYALCQPGVIQDQLNSYLEPHHLRLGADTSTGNRATLGGMCATNASGAHSLKYGSMVDHVLGIEMILSNGEKIWLDEKSQWPGLPRISSAPSLHRSSSGYLLYTLLEKSPNIAQLMVGSEGTLGIFTAIKLKLSPAITTRSLAIFPFPSLEESLEKSKELQSYRPISLEVIDHHIIEMGKLSPLLKGKLKWFNFEAQSLLIAEFETEKPPLMDRRQINLCDTSLQDEVWMLRKAGLGLLLSRRSYTRAIAFIEDLTVPPNNLVPFIRALKKLLPWEIGIYGHAGAGCLHTRPYINLLNRAEMHKIFHMMPQVAHLVKEFGGVLSGEHGDGILRSWLNKEFYSPELYQAMVDIKRSFDPLNLFNPKKIVDGTMPEGLVRTTRPLQITTFLNFEPEGGLHLATDLCNGNGACRKLSGLMCPSFQAFKDEQHSTRARAQSLRSILNGRLPISELTDKGLLDVLDYCLGCKGCKKECPSQVDMAKMKMEISYQYQEKHGYNLTNRLFGYLHPLSQMASKMAPFSHWIIKSPLSKIIQVFLKLTPERTLPPLAKRTFKAWWSRRPPMITSHRREKIYLFIDTFTDYYSPDIGIAAVTLLEKYHFEVEPLFSLCCGRPFLSVGMLRQAKEQAEKTAASLSTLKEPIVVLEPSCLSAIEDDYPSLISSSIRLYSIEEVLPPFQIPHPIFYHPHCHEQALKERSPLQKRFPQLILSQAGCCGLAGSFGYHKKHYPMSMAIANQHLFPQIQSHPDLPIMASGFSCRQQIAHGLHQPSFHPAQLILKFL